MTAGTARTYGFNNQLVPLFEAGSRTIINKFGLFVYDGAPAAGNLVASISPADGTDRYGNAWLGASGQIVQYFNTGGIGTLTTPIAAVALVGGGLNIRIAPTYAGPFAAATTILNQSILLLGDAVWIAPSGDLTGVTDWTNITNYIGMAGTGTIILLPGLFWISQPLIIARNNFTLRGTSDGRNFFTQISPGTAWTALPPTSQGMIVCGPTASSTRYTDICVTDLALVGSSVAGHLLVTRCEAPTYKHLTLQRPGDAVSTAWDCFHASWDGLGTTGFDTMLVEDVFCQTQSATGGARGFFLDPHHTDSDLIRCIADGTNYAAGGPPFTQLGLNGFEIQGHNIHGWSCHPFGFTNIGLYLNGAQDCQFDNGEYESCKAWNIYVGGGSDNKICNFNAYYNNGAYAGVPSGGDVHLDGGSDNTIENFTARSAGSVAYVEINGSQNAYISKFRCLPNALAAVSPVGILNDSGASVANGLKILDGRVAGPGTGANTVTVGNATDCLIRGVTVTTADKIAEGGTANFNIYSQNNVRAFGAGGIVTVGAGSIVAADNIF